MIRMSLKRTRILRWYIITNSYRHVFPECEKLDCSQYCDRVADGRYACSCYEGFTLYTDNKTCVDKGRLTYNL